MCTVAKLPRAAGWAWGSRKAAPPLEPELCLPPILSGTMCYFGNSLFPTLKRPCNYWVQFGAPCYIITQLSTSLDAMKINDHESLWWKAKLSTHLTRIQNQAKQHWNTSIFFSISCIHESRQSSLVGLTSLGLCCSFPFWLVRTSKQNPYMTQKKWNDGQIRVQITSIP